MIRVAGDGHPLLFYVLLIDNKRRKDRKSTSPECTGKDFTGGQQPPTGTSWFCVGIPPGTGQLGGSGTCRVLQPALRAGALQPSRALAPSRGQVVYFFER